MFTKQMIPPFGVHLFTVLYLLSSAPWIQAQDKSSSCQIGVSAKLKPVMRKISGIPVFFYLNGKSQSNNEEHISTAQTVPLVAIRIYQKLISPYLGVRCNFYPSCSEFGFQAYKKYGFLIGTLMLTDRLSRDHGFIRLGEYPRYQNGQFVDQVEDNYIFTKKHMKMQSMILESTRVIKFDFNR